MTAVVVDLENGKSSIRLSILNRHPEADWEGDLAFTGFDVEKVEVHELYSDDLTAVVSCLSLELISVAEPVLAELV